MQYAFIEKSFPTRYIMFLYEPRYDISLATLHSLANSLRQLGCPFRSYLRTPCKFITSPFLCSLHQYNFISQLIKIPAPWLVRSYFQTRSRLAHFATFLLSFFAKLSRDFKQTKHLPLHLHHTPGNVLINFLTKLPRQKNQISNKLAVRFAVQLLARRSKIPF